MGARRGLLHASVEWTCEREREREEAEQSSMRVFVCVCVIDSECAIVFVSG